MADSPPSPDSARSKGSDTRVRPDRRGMPRWVKVFVIIFIIVALLVVIIILTGNPFGGDMHMSAPMHMSTIERGVQPL